MIDIASGFVAIILTTFAVDLYHQAFEPARTVFDTDVDAAAVWFGGCIGNWRTFESVATHDRLQFSVSLNHIAQAQRLQRIFEHPIDSTLNCSLPEGRTSSLPSLMATIVPPCWHWLIYLIRSCDQGGTLA